MSANKEHTPKVAQLEDRSGQTIDRFEIYCLHARGGLGEVYRALDKELGREVALKAIRSDHRDSADCLRRFRTEAEVTSRLEHPGIAPVYGLVNDAVGQPAYAMRLLKGRTLKQLIREFHRSPGKDYDDESDTSTTSRSVTPAPVARGTIRGLLQRFNSLCRTVAYAHSQGIIHRDIKPSNVILGDFGETWLVDWGLAKIITQVELETPRPDPKRYDDDLSGLTTQVFDRPGSATDSTNPGQTIGTPGFMSPEQALGQWDLVGPSSDIFSLGATLYVILTGQSLHSGSVEEVRAKSRRGEFRPPRKLNPTVSPVLEAICLKALARDTDGRHASALDLAEDVERWLADEPISCFRDSWSKRMFRWGNRHRMLATSLVVGVLLATTFSLVLAANFASGQRRERALRENADQQRIAAEAQQKRADAAFAKAQEAIDDYLFKVSDSPELHDHDLTDLRQQLIGSTVPYYQWLAEHSGDESTFEFRRAQSLLKLAEVEERVSKLVDSLSHVTAAESLARKLLEATPQDSRTRRLLADSLSLKEHDLRQQGQSDLASQTSSEALEIYRDLVSQEHQASDELALLSIEARLLDELTEAERPGDVVQQADLLIVRDKPQGLSASQARRWDIVIAEAHAERGGARKRLGKIDEAATDILRGIELRSEQLRQQPQNGENQYGLSQMYYSLGQVRFLQKNLPAAIESYEHALDGLKNLVKQRPNVPYYQYTLCWVYHNLGMCYKDAGNLAPAYAALEQAAVEGEDLVRKAPEDPEYTRGLAWFVEGRAHAAVAKGDNKVKLECYQRAMQLRRQYLMLRPDSKEGLLDLGWSILRIAEELRNASDLPAAELLYREGHNIATQLLQTESGHLGSQELLRCTAINLASSPAKTTEEELEHLKLLEQVLPHANKQSPLIAALMAISLCRLDRVTEADQKLTEFRDAPKINNHHKDYTARALAAVASRLPESERELRILKILEQLDQIVHPYYNADLFISEEFRFLQDHAEFIKLKNRYEMKL